MDRENTILPGNCAHRDVVSTGFADAVVRKIELDDVLGPCDDLQGAFLKRIPDRKAEILDYALSPQCTDVSQNLQYTQSRWCYTKHEIFLFLATCRICPNVSLGIGADTAEYWPHFPTI